MGRSAILNVACFWRLRNALPSLLEGSLGCRFFNLKGRAFGKPLGQSVLGCLWIKPPNWQDNLLFLKRLLPPNKLDELAARMRVCLSPVSDPWPNWLPEKDGRGFENPILIGCRGSRGMTTVSRKNLVDPEVAYCWSDCIELKRAFEFLWPSSKKPHKSVISAPLTEFAKLAMHVIFDFASQLGFSRSRAGSGWLNVEFKILGEKIPLIGLSMAHDRGRGTYPVRIRVDLRVRDDRAFPKVCLFQLVAVARSRHSGAI